MAESHRNMAQRISSERNMSLKIARMPATAIIAKKWQLKAHMQNFRLKFMFYVTEFL